MAADNSNGASAPAGRRGRRWIVALQVVGVLLVSIAIAIAWYCSDSQRVRALAEKAVSALTGRALTIRGDFAFHIGREISVSGAQITWANAAWSNSPAMLSVGSLEFAVDTRSLLERPLLITRVVASDAQLHFEWTADGESNWQLGGADYNETQEPFQWRLLQADLRNVDVHIRPQGSDEELQIQAKELTQQQDDSSWQSGLPMTFRATDVSLSNPDWASDPDMLNVAAAEATLDFTGFVQPPLLIHNLTAHDAQLDFEWHPDGRFNWDFDTGPTPEEEPEHVFAWLLDKADLQNVALRFQHPSQTSPLLIDVKQAKQQQDASQRLIVDIAATTNGKPVDLHGRIGPFPELVTAGAVDFAVAVDGPSSKLRLLGRVAELSSLQRPNFEFDWSAPEVEKTFELFNLTPVASGKAAFQGFVMSGPKGTEGLINGTMGEFTVSGSLQAAKIQQLAGLSLSDLDGVALNLQSHGPSARAAGKILAVDGLPPEPYELDVQIQDTTAGLEIQALRFTTAGAVATGTGIVHDFPSLQRLDLDLQLKTNDITPFSGLLPADKKLPALPLSVEGKIRSNTDDTNDSVTADAQIGTIRANLSGVLTEQPRFADSAFDWSLTAPDAKTAGAVVGIQLLQSTALSADGKLTVNPTGVSLRNTVVKLGPNTAKVTGEIPLVDTGSPVQIAGNVAGPNLRNLVNLFAASEQVPNLPYTLDTQLRYAEPNLELQSLNGKVGNNTLQSKGSLRFGRQWPDMNLQLSAEGPQLEQWLSELKLEEQPTGKFKVSGNLKQAAGSTDISGLSLETTRANVQGSVALGWPAKPERVEFDISATGSNLGTFLPEIDNYRPANVPFRITAQGKLDDKQVDFPQLAATIGSAHVNLRGKLDFSSAVQTDGATLEASGPRISDLGTGDTWSLPEAPFNITAQLIGGANHLELNNFTGKFGSSDMRGNVKLTGGDIPRIDIVASSNRLDVRPFEDMFDDQTAPAAAAAQPTSEPKRRRLIPDDPIPLERLKSIDGTMQLTASKFISSRMLFDMLTVNAKLADGNLDFNGSSQFSDKGNMQLALILRQPPGKLPHTEFTATARNVQYELNQLDQTLQGYNMIQDIDAYLIGDGENLRAIAGNVNGYLWLRGGGQRMPTNQFGFFFGDFLTGVLEKINPFAKKEPYQMIQCVVAAFEATDGTLKTSPAALLSTDKLNIGAAGTINLANEKIVLNIRADARTGVGISAGSLLNPFIGLRGTLSDPKVSLDPKGTLLEGGAAVATSGLSILAESLYKRWFGSRDPCEKVIEEARKIRQKHDPAHVPTG